MNLRPSVTSKGIVWEEIGVWKSWQTNAQQQLDIRDIYWPGNSHVPVR
jgi:ionotropic glutamate receptor NMDA 2B